MQTRLATTRVLSGQRRGAGDKEAHGRGDSGVHFQQANVDCGDAEEEGGLEMVEDGCGFLILEAFE